MSKIWTTTKADKQKVLGTYEITFVWIISSFPKIDQDPRIREGFLTVCETGKTVFRYRRSWTKRKKAVENIRSRITKSAEERKKTSKLCAIRIRIYLIYPLAPRDNCLYVFRMQFSDANEEQPFPGEDGINQRFSIFTMRYRTTVYGRTTDSFGSVFNLKN